MRLIRCSTSTIVKNRVIYLIGMHDPIQTVTNEILVFFTEPNAFRSVFILLLALFIAYWFSKLVALSIVKVAQLVAVSSDTTDNVERQIRLRRVETYLSVAIALVRSLIVGVEVTQPVSEQ